MKLPIVCVISLAAAGALSANSSVSAKKSLTLEGAGKVIAAAKAEALRHNEGGTIAVVDDGGNLMALERIDGSFPAGANISIGKARTAALFKKPTKFFEDVIGKGRTSMVALNDFTPLQGGIPLLVDEQIVGAVGVSGAATAADDEAVAMAGAAGLNEASAGVSYFDHSQVESAFEKGSILFKDSPKYMVHASRRQEPGMAEIHTLDADIIYVLEGKATFITGGTAVDTKTTAPDEIRGSEINGGDTRELSKGDVIIVPAGTPHQFKEVTNPFLYYVVKAR
jgi:glc operon protein GlcG